MPMTDTKNPPKPQERAHKPHPAPNDAELRQRIGAAWWTYLTAVGNNAHAWKQRRHLLDVCSAAAELIRRLDAANPGVI